MTVPLDALAEDVRVRFGTDRDPDRWAATVVLNVLVPRELPAGSRMTPSTHETRLVEFLASCDLANLYRMLAVEPEYVLAFAIYAYVRGGTDRLKALAAGEGNRDERLVQRALDAYATAAVAGEHLDGAFAADDVQAARDLSAWRQVETAAALLPELAGTLDRLRERRRR